MSLTRRHLIGGGVLLASGWAVALAVGHRPLPGPDPDSPYLGPGPRRTLEAALAPLLPPAADVVEVAAGVDAHLARTDPVLAGQLAVALRVLEHGSGLVRFSRTDLESRRRILEAWRRSPWSVRRQIADAIRRLALFSWYSRPETWAAIGYDGPWVGR